jgi:SAM-dependent methyltransferase
MFPGGVLFCGLWAWNSGDESIACGDRSSGNCQKGPNRNTDVVRFVRWLKDIVKRSSFGVCGYLIATDRAAAMRYSLGYTSTDSGMTHASLSVEASIAYITEVFYDYKRYSGVKKFHGRVVEVGPGDNCSVGLLFLADGCERADLVDRFYSRRDSHHQSLIYEKLLEVHPELKKFCKGYPADESAFDGINRYYGEEASAERFFRNHGPYDFIFSRSTLEHIYDIAPALGSMANALKSEGMLLHKVDLRDHRMFSEKFHELRFLEVSDWLYPQMTRASGRPNRVRVDQYREALQKERLTFSLLVTRLAGVGDIVPHQPYERIPEELRQKSIAYVRSVKARFARSLRAVLDEDLSIDGFFLVARKL